MCAAVRERLWVPEVLLLSGDGPHDIVAVVQSDDGERGVCWWNRQVVKGVELYYIELWAMRSIFYGRRFRTMGADEIAKLREETWNCV